MKDIWSFTFSSFPEKSLLLTKYILENRSSVVIVLSAVKSAINIVVILFKCAVRSYPQYGTLKGTMFFYLQKFVFELFMSMYLSLMIY
jgi:hypothetical protein